MGSKASRGKVKKPAGVELKFSDLKKLSVDLRATMREVACASAEIDRFLAENSGSSSCRLHEKDSRHIKKIIGLVEKSKEIRTAREGDRLRAEMAQDIITLAEIFKLFSDGECEDHEIPELCKLFVSAEKKKYGVWKSLKKGKLKNRYNPLKKHNKLDHSYDMISKKQIAELGGPAKAASVLLSIHYKMGEEAMEAIRKGEMKRESVKWMEPASTRTALLHFIGSVTGTHDLKPEFIREVLYRNDEKLEFSQHQDLTLRGYEFDRGPAAIREDLRDELKESRERYRKMYPEEFESEDD
jgi:hypothetical protein